MEWRDVLKFEDISGEIKKVRYKVSAGSVDHVLIELEDPASRQLLINRAALGQSVSVGAWMDVDQVATDELGPLLDIISRVSRGEVDIDIPRTEPQQRQSTSSSTGVRPEDAISVPRSDRKEYNAFQAAEVCLGLLREGWLPIRAFKEQGGYVLDCAARFDANVGNLVYVEDIAGRATATGVRFYQYDEIPTRRPLGQ